MIFTARQQGAVLVNPCLSDCLSVTRWYCIKMTQTGLHWRITRWLWFFVVNFVVKSWTSKWNIRRRAPH